MTDPPEQTEVLEGLHSNDKGAVVIISHAGMVVTGKKSLKKKAGI